MAHFFPTAVSGLAGYRRKGTSHEGRLRAKQLRESVRKQGVRMGHAGKRVGSKTARAERSGVDFHLGDLDSRKEG